MCSRILESGVYFVVGFYVRGWLYGVEVVLCVLERGVLFCAAEVWVFILVSFEVWGFCVGFFSVLVDWRLILFCCFWFLVFKIFFYGVGGRVFVFF